MMAEAADDALPKQKQTYQIEAKNLQKGLAKMWNNTCLFDIKLIAEEREFLAHKIILAASSPYFEAMFTHGFKEEEIIESTDGMPTIVLHSVSSAALEIILKGIYTGELEIDEVLLPDIVDLASYLQYEQVLYYCEAFIEETVIHRNLFDYLELAYKYNLDYATNVTIQTLLDNFDALFNQVHEGSCELNGEYVSRFLELPEELVVHCLKSDTLVQGYVQKSNVSGEEMLLFHLACKWLEHKKERLKLSKKLLECVRLAHLTPDHLKEVSAHQLVSKDDKCLQRVLIAEEYLKDELAKPLYPEDLHTPRGDLEFVFIEVTDQDEHLRFSCYNNRDLRSTRDITPIGRGIMPLSVKSVHAGHFVYLLGILSGTGHYDNVMFRCHGNWDTDECLMLNALEGSGRFWGVVAYCDEHIYMAGGILMHDWMMSHEANFHRHVTATSFKYSIRLNTWESTASLPFGCINGDMSACDGIVYYAGPAMYEDGNGSANDFLHPDSFQCLLAYDKSKDEWTYQEPMLHRREKFSLNAVGNKLYVMGGYQKVSEEEVTHSPPEVYDTKTCQWTELEGWECSPYLWVTPCSFVHKNDIYILGEGQMCGPDGYPERTEYFKDIHVYHAKTNKWSMLNQERELKMEDLPYIMCYRIPPAREKGIANYPPPRVDHS